MRVVFFDLETQNLVSEVGGWGSVEALRISVACTFDQERGYRDWWEAQAGDLLQVLRGASQIVGFNLNAFDFRVLAPYGDVSALVEKTFDMHAEIHRQTGRRVGLNSLAVINLGEAKAFESGVQAVRLWRTGRLEELVNYCRRDVELTRRLYELWQSWGLLWVSGLEYAVWPGVRAAG